LSVRGEGGVEGGLKLDEVKGEGEGREADEDVEEAGDAGEGELGVFDGEGVEDVGARIAPYTLC
jgi:hypothetical protein